MNLRKKRVIQPYSMKDYILPIFALVIGVAVGYLVVTNTPVGSVSVSNEYNATTTDSTSADTVSVLTNRGCTVGSVVIATSSSGTLTIKNATSQIDTASSTLILIPINTIAGTYTYDITCDRGLVLEIGAGFDGEYVVTWR